MNTLNQEKVDARLRAPGSSSRWRQKLRQKLLDWYSTAARDLPWRRDLDPYRVWVSEIMLQQTQVATVVPYFERFVAAFPTVEALAAAAEDDVLRLWEGLGYYRRARHMQQAAQQIVAEHGGQFPSTLEGLRQLPGIGRYTAGAILSIAFDAREPILEANTVRLYSRLFGYRGDVNGSAGQDVLWQFARDVLPKQGAGTVNQALMELGSQICTPREPRCLLCPLATLCVARARGWQQQIPRPKPRPQFEAVEHVALAVWRRKRVLLVRRHDDARWARFWDFPRFALEDAQASTAGAICAAAREQTGYEISLGELLGTLKHGVTRFKITLSCYHAVPVRKARQAGTATELRWVLPAELGDYPLSASGRRLCHLICVG